MQICGGGFLATLPIGADGDLKTLAGELLVYVNRFPDWVAYRDDAAPVTVADVIAAKPDFDAIRDILNATEQATAEVKDEYAAEVAEGTQRTATEIEAKALVASTRELGRETAESNSAEQRRNRALAKKGGEIYDKWILGPAGLPHHFAMRLEQPLRRLAKRFPMQFGWVGGWYDATFGPAEQRDGDLPKG